MQAGLRDTFNHGLQVQAGLHATQVPCEAAQVLVAKVSDGGDPDGVAIELFSGLRDVVIRQVGNEVTILKLGKVVLIFWISKQKCGNLVVGETEIEIVS